LDSTAGTAGIPNVPNGFSLLAELHIETDEFMIVGVYDIIFNQKV
jgi:hypothetical protein